MNAAIAGAGEIHPLLPKAWRRAAEERLHPALFISLVVLMAGAPGCESMNEKIAASRQDRCERADWKLVGQRDGVEGVKGAADRYAHICGDMFQPGPYSEGLRDGMSRRPATPGM